MGAGTGRTLQRSESHARPASCASSGCPAKEELFIVVASAVVLPCAGVAFFHWIERIARKRGSLGEF